MDKPYRDMAYLSYTLLRTPEVLEIVLSSTRNTDLIVFRQVCRQMRSVIDRSPPLQRKLFRLPDFTSKPKAVGWIVSDVGKDFAFIGINKVFKLNHHGIPLFDAVPDTSEPLSTADVPTLATTSLPNTITLLPNNTNPSSTIETSSCGNLLPPHNGSRTPVVPLNGTVGPVLNVRHPTKRGYQVEPYYHDMYLVQPPIKSVGWINYKCIENRPRREEMLEFSCKTGLNLGHLIDVFERDIQGHILVPRLHLPHGGPFDVAPPQDALESSRAELEVTSLFGKVNLRASTDARIWC
ncbi:hypothetical protein BDV97DRAFT_399088 [Delphinella strobiligena]|nr:hypothetical protein BDV97DRAFT_399088 [Delphinella strobiligena]